MWPTTNDLGLARDMQNKIWSIELEVIGNGSAIGLANYGSAKFKEVHYDLYTYYVDISLSLQGDDTKPNSSAQGFLWQLNVNKRLKNVIWKKYEVYIFTQKVTAITIVTIWTQFCVNISPRIKYKETFCSMQYQYNASKCILKQSKSAWPK